MNSMIETKTTDNSSLYEFPLAGTSVINLDVTKIIPNPSQPRKNFSDRALESLSDSISRHGILQPLLVRGCGSFYEIIAGERRYRAALMAGLDTVPCIIKESDTKSSAELAIIENLQREDLNMFEEAEAIEKLIETCGITQDAAAVHLSCSQSYIANKLRLLKLPALQRHAIIECGLTERHARALLRVHDNEDRAEILAVVIKRKLNVAATEDYIENHLCRKEQFLHAQKTAKIEKDIKRKLLSKDMRLFYNSIDRAVTSVRDCGFSVDQTREVTEEGTLISIFIKKKE